MLTAVQDQVTLKTLMACVVPFFLSPQRCGCSTEWVTSMASQCIEIQQMLAASILLQYSA